MSRFFYCLCLCLCRRHTLKAIFSTLPCHQPSILLRKSIVILRYRYDSTPSVSSRAFRASQKVEEDEERNERDCALFAVAQKAHENWYILLLSVFVSFALTSSLCKLIPDLRTNPFTFVLLCEQSKIQKDVLFHEALQYFVVFHEACDVLMFIFSLNLPNCVTS